MDDQWIYVVYYADQSAPIELLKAFSSQRRAAECVAMLQNAPYPNHEAAHYHYTAVQLN